MQSASILALHLTCIVQVKKKQLQPSDERRSSCPISVALEIFGDKWTLLVIRDMILFGKTTYGEFQASPERIATNILADRLQRLEKAGLIERSADPENKRRTIYKLTESGSDLLPVLTQIIIWSARHDPNTVVSGKLLSRLQRHPEAILDELRKRKTPAAAV